MAKIFQEANEKFCEQNVSKPSFDREMGSTAKNEKSLQPLIHKDYRLSLRYDSDWARTSDPHPVNFVSQNQTSSVKLNESKKA